MKNKSMVEFIVSQISQDSIYAKGLQKEIIMSFKRFTPEQRLAVDEMFITLTGYSFEALKTMYSSSF